MQGWPGLILDKPNPVTDRRLAKHLVALFYKQGATRAASVDPKLLADYISHARLHVQPRITDEAAKALVAGYVDMRMVGNSVNHARNKKLITATPRQLEAIIRLSEAHARLHYRDEVKREDVLEAVRLMNVATQKAATDPTTGTIDMDMITTGRSAATRESLNQLRTAVQDLLKQKGTGTATRVGDVMASIKAQTDIEIPESDLIEVLRRLRDENFLKFNEAKRVRRLIKS